MALFKPCTTCIARNSKKIWAKLFLLKYFESATKRLYPKNVSGSVQVLKQRIKVDKLDFFKNASFFLFWVVMNIQKDWNAKLEIAYTFMLKYSKITVCCIYFILPKTDFSICVECRQNWQLLVSCRFILRITKSRVCMHSVTVISRPALSVKKFYG